MRRALKWILISLGVILILGFFFVAMPVLELVGAFDEEPSLNVKTNCQPIKGAVGAEDIAIDSQTGLAILSSFDRRAGEGDKSLRGNLYLLDLSDRNPTPQIITPQTPRDFRPLGLAIQRNGDSARLFVINHPAQNPSAVEIYDWNQRETLTHLKTITSPLFNFPNSIQPINEEQFYITNSFGLDEEYRIIETLLQIPSSRVLFFDGKTMQNAAMGLRNANGMHFSKDHSKLYVSEIAGRSVQIYHHDAQTHALVHHGALDVAGSPDNIKRDEEGNLWVAAHPNLSAIPQNAQDPSSLAPSFIFRIDGETNEIEDIYYNEGEEISAATVAAPFDDGFLIGNLFEDYVLLCRLAP